MIIGDGIMLGAGGETASIVVTAPTGSTVTCTTPGGIVLTVAEVSGKWTFSKLKVYGTYTITATDGTKTKTSDVLVDSALEYVVEMIFELRLYWEGDECEDVTGGWTHDGYGSFNTIQTKSGTKATSYFDLGSKSTTELFVLGTKNKINLTGYTTLYCEYTANVAKAPGVILTANQSPPSWSGLGYLSSSITGNNKIMSQSLSISAERYVMAVNLIMEPSATTARIHKIWLE